MNAPALAKSDVGFALADAIALSRATLAKVCRNLFRWKP